MLSNSSGFSISRWNLAAIALHLFLETLVKLLLHHSISSQIVSYPPGIPRWFFRLILALLTDAVRLYLWVSTQFSWPESLKRQERFRWNLNCLSFKESQRPIIRSSASGLGQRACGFGCYVGVAFDHSSHFTWNGRASSIIYMTFGQFSPDTK